MKLAITKKLSICLLIILVVLGSAAGVILSTLHRIDGRVKDVGELNAVSELTNELQIAVEALVMPANDYLITGDTAERQNQQRLADKVDLLLSQLHSRNLGDKGPLFDEVKAHYESVLNQATAILQVPNPIGNAAAGAAMEKMDDEADKLIASAQEMRQAFGSRVSLALKDTEKRALLVQVLLLASGAVFALVLVLVFGLVNWDIVVPMRLMIEGARVAAGGDLSRSIKVKAGSGFDELAAEFNRMVSNLRALVGSITKLSAEVSSASSRLAVSAVHMSEVTGQVASVVKNLAAGADEQAEQANAAGDTMAGMYREVDRVSGQVGRISDEAAVMNLTADEGGKSAERSVREMSSIRLGVDEIMAAVEGLGQRSSQVGRIVETISGIAEQTNLLALNAAIEAARAGEQGRGFAVVADEVRKLAEESKSSAAEIGRLVKEIQADIASAVETSRVGRSRVDEGAAVISSVGEVFGRIFSAAQRVGEAVSESSVSVASLRGDAGEVVKSVRSMATITGEYAAGAEEVVASSASQTEEIREVAGSAEALARLAKDLEEVVASFRV